MADDWNDPPEETGAPPEVQPAESAPEPPAQQPAHEPPAPAAAHPLQPMLDRLPNGLRTALALQPGAPGYMTPEQAILRHFGNWDGHFNRLNAQNREMRQTIAQQAESGKRFDAFMKRLADTLGFELEEQQPQAPADPLAPVHEKLDAVLAVEEERQLDGHIASVDNYVAQSTQAILAEEPEYAAAQEYVANRVLDFQRQRASEAAAMRDYSFFPAEYLQALVDGQMTEEELIVRTAIERAMDIAAQTQLQHARGGDPLSYARDVLQIARKAGWQPAGQTQQPAPPRAPRQPAPAQPDPRVEALRRRGQNALPAPASGARARINPEQIKKNLAQMKWDEFEEMLDGAEDHEQLRKRLLEAVAVH